MSKRKVQTIWFEVTMQGNPKAWFFRNSKPGKSALPSAYTPSRSSCNRLNRLAHRLSRSALQPFSCEITADKDIIVGWSLIREERLYIPPQMGTQITGHHLVNVPK